MDNRQEQVLYTDVVMATLLSDVASRGNDACVPRRRTWFCHKSLLTRRLRCPAGHRSFILPDSASVMKEVS